MSATNASPAPSVSSAPMISFEDARAEQLETANRSYYNLLDDYISLNQRYMNGERGDNIEEKLQSINRKLVDIATSVQRDNAGTAEDVSALFDDYERSVRDSLVGHSEALQSKTKVIAERSLELESVKQLIAQLQTNQRRMTLHRIIYIVFSLVLLFALLYLISVIVYGAAT